MISYVALLATLVGAVTAMIALRLNYRQRLRQFEQMYVQRYWNIIDRCSLKAMNKNVSAGYPAEEDEKAIRAYIRLCEEELMVRAGGWISDATYNIWASATCKTMQLPMFRQVWRKVIEDSIFEHEFLRRLLEEGESYDPCPMNHFSRWLHVLTGSARHPSAPPPIQTERRSLAPGSQ